MTFKNLQPTNVGTPVEAAAADDHGRRGGGKPVTTDYSFLSYFGLLRNFPSCGNLADLRAK